MPWLPKQKIVVPVDLSYFSAAAVETALQLGASPESIHVIYVLPDLSPAEVPAIYDLINMADRTARAKQALEQQFSGPKFQGIDLFVVVGDPGTEIVKHAEYLAADLIVIPSHGRTGLPRFFLGSVAERVARLAHCPVLILKQPAEKK